MKILHTESSCGWGGQEIRILSEAEGLVARGHQVSLVAPREAQIHAAAVKRGVSVAALPIARKGLRGVMALRSWLAEHPPDVVNTHSSTDTWLTALACATLSGSPPMVRTRHISAPIPNNSLTRWLYLRATRHIVTTGEALRAQLVRDNRFPADRITSVPTGIDPGRFVPGDRNRARRSTGLPQDRPLVGIVATLRSWKGHRYLIEAFSRLPREVGLVIVGDGPQRQNVESQLDELQLRERVWLAGNREDVLPWLQSLDVFALPSYANEGVPQALIQAMLVGLPCVTTNIGSMAELAIHEKTALVVPPEDVAALRAALKRLLQDRTLSETLGGAARRHCAERFSYDTMLTRMEAIYKEAADAHR